MTLREPLWTTMVVLYFKTSTIDQVIDKGLTMDWDQNCSSMLMGALQRAFSQGQEPVILTGNTMHNLLEPGPLKPGMHDVNTLCTMPLKGTYNRAVRVQFVKSSSSTGTPHRAPRGQTTRRRAVPTRGLIQTEGRFWYEDI